MSLPPVRTQYTHNKHTYMLTTTTVQNKRVPVGKKCIQESPRGNTKKIEQKKKEGGLNILCLPSTFTGLASRPSFPPHPMHLHFFPPPNSLSLAFFPMLTYSPPFFPLRSHPLSLLLLTGYLEPFTVCATMCVMVVAMSLRMLAPSR